MKRVEFFIYNSGNVSLHLLIHYLHNTTLLAQTPHTDTFTWVIQTLTVMDLYIKFSLSSFELSYTSWRARDLVSSLKLSCQDSRFDTLNTTICLLTIIL